MQLSELRSELADLLHRSDLSDSQLNGFINRGCQTVGRIIRAIEAEASDTWTSASPALPADFARMRYVTRPSGSGFFELKPMSALEAAKWSDASNSDSIGYLVTGTSMAVYPADASTHTIYYFKNPSTLSADGDTNYLTVSVATVSLYAAAVEGALWERDAQAQQAFQAHLSGLVELVNNEADRQRAGSGLVAASHYQAETYLPRGM